MHAKMIRCLYIGGNLKQIEARCLEKIEGKPGDFTYDHVLINDCVPTYFY